MWVTHEITWHKDTFDTILAFASGRDVEREFETDMNYDCQFKFPECHSMYYFISLYMIRNNLKEYDEKMKYAFMLCDRLAKIDKHDPPMQKYLDYKFTKDDLDDYLFYLEHGVGVDEEWVKKIEHEFEINFRNNVTYNEELWDLILSNFRFFSAESQIIFDNLPETATRRQREIVDNMLALLDYKKLGKPQL